jgi:hypothetical protein
VLRFIAHPSFPGVRPGFGRGSKVSIEQAGRRVAGHWVQPRWAERTGFDGYMLRRRRMRSSMGGWVLKRLLRKLWCSRSGL